MRLCYRAALSLVVLFTFSSSLATARIFAPQAAPSDKPAVAEPLAQGLRPSEHAAKALNQDDFDVLDYQLELVPDFGTELLIATVTIDFRSQSDALDHVDLNFYEFWTITDLNQVGKNKGDIPVKWTHEGELLSIHFEKPVKAGRKSRVRISYKGAPQAAGFLGMQFLEHDGVPILATVSQTDFARSWWPCKDVLDDKATVTLSSVVPEGMVCASNGLLESVTPEAPGLVRYTWREGIPISTYLVSVAITNFVGWQDTYVSPSGQTMPVEYLVFPEDLAAAQVDFERTTEMIDLFVGYFGDYPFLDEKYGMAEILFDGAMEHQTMTSYGQVLITGNKRFEHLVAHELSHQWFGDSNTLSDWNDIWLNEGFAEYCGGLWVEHARGSAAFHRYMNSRAATSVGLGGAIVPPISLFNRTVYWKGAWVLHMLRYVLGDQIFFASLRDYADELDFRYGNVTTADFVTTVSNRAGVDMGWFFDQWLYREGRPTYRLSWTSVPEGAEYRVSITIEQVHEGELYAMPLDLAIESGAGTLLDTVTIESEAQELSYLVSDPPTGVRIDPDGWVLARYEVVEVPCTVAIPDAPGDLSVVAVGDAEIALSWSDESLDEEGFRIERDAGQGFAELATVAADVATYADGAVDCSATYSYRVSAFNCAGASSAAWPQEATTLPCPGNLVHVAAIDLAIDVRDLWTNASGSVTLVDELGNPVSGATVDVSWGGTTSGTQGAVTDADGQARFESKRIRGIDDYCWILSVTNVTGSDVEYDPSSNVVSSEDVGTNCIEIAERSGEGPPLENYPNPFNPSTTFRFAMPTNGHVRLTIYDVSGRAIVTLLDEHAAAGDFEVSWTGIDAAGQPVASGVYYAQLNAGDSRRTHRVLLVK